MTAISKLLEKEINGLTVKLFQLDVDNEESFSEVKNYLTDRIRKSKVYNTDELDLKIFGAKNLNPEFVQRFNEQTQKINTPNRAKYHICLLLKR